MTALAYVTNVAPSLLNGSGTATTPSWALTTGQHVFVQVAFSFVSPTSITVTDTAGNTYTALTKTFAAGSNSGGHQWFYCLNATGNAANVVSVAITYPSGGAVAYVRAVTLSGTTPTNVSLTTTTSSVPNFAQASTVTCGAGGMLLVGTSTFSGDSPSPIHTVVTPGAPAWTDISSGNNFAYCGYLARPTGDYNTVGPIFAGGNINTPNQHVMQLLVIDDGSTPTTPSNVSKLYSYALTGGAPDKATASKLTGYALTGGAPDKATLSKLTGYAVVDTSHVAALDGTATGIKSGSGAVVATLTTTKANDIICVVVYVENNGSTAPTVSSVTATGLTFTRRKQVLGTGSNSVLESWWAVATSPVSSLAISAAFTGAYDNAAVVAFGVSNCNTTSPWDANSSLPASVLVPSGTTPPTFTGISTSSPNDFLIFFNGTNHNWGSLGTVPTGFTGLAIATNNGGSLWAHLGGAFEAVSTTQSGATFAWGSFVPNDSISLFDALTADTPATSLQTSQLVAEVLQSPTPNMQTSQLVAEVLQLPGGSNLRTSQLVAEVLRVNAPAIINDRDLLLQATVPRYTTSTINTLLLAAPTPMFHVNSSGVAVPTSITVTATLIGMTGTATFTAAGGSTITTLGNTATLAYSAMSGASETINASFTSSEGVTYTSSYLIGKVVDGSTGSSGTSPPRSPVNVAFAGYSAWSDSAAVSELSGAGYGSPVNRDIVTLYDSSHSTTKYYLSGSWLTLSAYVNGNMLISGTLSVGTLDIAGNAVTVSQVASGSSTITGTGSDITILTATVTVPFAGYYLANFACRQESNAGPQQWTMYLKFDGSTVFTTGGGTGGVGYAFTDSVAMSGAAFLSAGSHTVDVVWNGDTTMDIASRTLSVVSAMR